jgi:hypothetical protein
MVMNVMGHTDVRTAMRYQHPVLDSVREAIDQLCAPRCVETGAAPVTWRHS